MSPLRVPSFTCVCHRHCTVLPPCRMCLISPLLACQETRRKGRKKEGRRRPAAHAATATLSLRYHTFVVQVLYKLSGGWKNAEPISSHIRSRTAYSNYVQSVSQSRSSLVSPYCMRPFPEWPSFDRVLLLLLLLQLLPPPN